MGYTSSRQIKKKLCFFFQTLYLQNNLASPALEFFICPNSFQYLLRIISKKRGKLVIFIIIVIFTLFICFHWNSLFQIEIQGILPLWYGKDVSKIFGHSCLDYKRGITWWSLSKLEEGWAPSCYLALNTPLLQRYKTWYPYDPNRFLGLWPEWHDVYIAVCQGYIICIW